MEEGQTLSTIKERRQDQSWFFHRKDYRKKWQRRMCVLGSVPVKVISLARNIGTTEEQSREQRCLFRRRDYRENGSNLENVSWFFWLGN